MFKFHEDVIHLPSFVIQNWVSLKINVRILSASLNIGKDPKTPRVSCIHFYSRTAPPVIAAAAPDFFPQIVNKMLLRFAEHISPR